MKIENPANNSTVSNALELYRDLLDEDKIAYSINRDKGSTKDNGQIVDFMVYIAGFAAKRMAWELLKVAIQRTLEAVGEKVESKISIDGQSFNLNDFPPKPPTSDSQ